MRQLTGKTKVDDRFVGWHRPSSFHGWRPVVGGETEDEAWGLLLGYVVGGDKAVLPAGKRPTDRHPRQTH